MSFLTAWHMANETNPLPPTDAGIQRNGFPAIFASVQLSAYREANN